MSSLLEGSCFCGGNDQNSLDDDPGPKCIERCEALLPKPVLQGTRMVQRLQTRLCGNALDDYSTGQTGTRQRIVASGKKKGVHVLASSASSSQDSRLHREIELGLPPLDRDYEADPKVDASTGFGSGLKRYIHKKTRMPRAVLSIPKAAVPMDISSGEIDRQLQFLCRIDHPNIVPFREACEDNVRLQLVYEWCDGGLLMHQLSRYTGMLTEGHIAQVIREVLSALTAAHTFGVHHLDLGLFSVFLQYTDRLSPIKLFGIGLAGFLFPAVTARKHSKCNKHYYASPEMFASKFIKGLNPSCRHASDIWSVGTILYTLCSGRPPFGAGSIKDIAPRVQKAVWKFGIEFSEYSSTLKDLLENLLRMPWMRRPTGAAALKHSWVTHTQTLQMKDGKISSMAMSQLKNFAQEDHCKQTVARLLTDIGLTINAYQDLEKMFKELDLNGDGTITLGELVEVASKMPGMTATQVDQIITKLDRNGNCNVDISEFIAALVMEQDEADERLIRKAFSKMDKNGDARVTKKELFTVLRQYSGSVETNEVSQFVGKADDDGDQKIDYREFMGLFPQVRDKYDEIDRRMSDAKLAIEQTPRSLDGFKQNLDVWLNTLGKHRDKIEVACGVQQMPPEMAAGAHYSYIQGHFTEFDVQMMIRDIVHHLKTPPGRRLSRAQKNRRARRQKKEKETGGKTEQKQMRLMVLSALKKDKDAQGPGDAQIRRQNSGSGSDSNPSSGSEDERRVRNVINGDSAISHWEEQVAKDRKELLQDPEWRPETYLVDYLHQLMKVKSEFHWQLPLLDTIKALREVCVEEIYELHIHRKHELSQLQAQLNDRYVMREDSHFEDSRQTIHKESRMLPMGSFKHKNLKSNIHLEKMQEMHLPVHIFFGLAKEDITHQKIEQMRDTHIDKMSWVGKFCTYIINTCQDLMEDVAEDIQMSGTMESVMPSPPPMSHLYLKHCVGREIAEDAATPRSDEVAASDEDEQELAVSTSMNSHHSHSQSQGGLQSTNLGATTTGSVRFDKGPKKKKIERNTVLTQQVAAARQR